MDKISAVSAETIQAYRETEFRVFADKPFVLHVSKMSSDLLDLYRNIGFSSCAFVTACNPYGEMQTDARNMELQQQLRTVLSSAGFKFISGEGKHPVGDWPGEASFLVLDMTFDAANNLGHEFKQNAIVWCGAEAIPELVLLR